MPGSAATLQGHTEELLSKLRKAVATGAVRSRRRVRVVAIRLGIRVSLITAVLATMGSFAVVAGGISPADVFAPRGPESPNLLAAAAIPQPEPVDYSTSPLQVESTGPIPSADFIRSEIAALPTVVPGTRLSETEVKVYASLAGWPSELHPELLVVAHCESKNRPYATNGVMRGLMQLHPIWFGYSANSLDDWANPITNLRVAYSAYLYDLGRGNAPWTQWQCKPDGSVASAPAPAPELVLDDSGPATAASNGEPAAETVDEPKPTPTAAPWDTKPVWPPKPTSSGTAPAP